MTSTSLKLARIMATLCVCAFGAGRVDALITTSGCSQANLSCTLQELAAGGSITIGAERFHNWRLDDASTQAVDVSAVVVTALDDLPGQPGLRFVANGQLRTTGFDLIDLDIRFDVLAIDGLTVLTGHSLRLDQLAFGVANQGGFIGVSEDAFSAGGIALLGELFVFADHASLAQALFDSAAWAEQASMLVATNILLTGDDPGDTTRLESFTQRFTQRSAQVPEPATLLLLAIGLAALQHSRQRVQAKKLAPTACSA